jgi:hypothetical protein
VNDDTAAIRACFTSMGTHPRGRLVFPAGVYRTTSTLDFDLGYADSATVNNPTAGGFELDMQGSIRPDAGIGAAVYLHSGYYPQIKFKVDGGGGCASFDGVKCSDQALKVDRLTAPVISISCKDYAGTAFSAVTALANGAGSAKLATISSIQSAACGQMLALDGHGGGGNGANGFGQIVEAFDAGSAHGSVIQYMGDVTIGHYENDSVTDAVTTLAISNSASVNMGVISLGGAPNAANIFTVGPFNNRITAQKILVLGWAPLGWSTLNPVGLAAQNGLKVSGGSVLEVGNLTSLQMNGVALLNVGANVTVSQFNADTDTHHLEASTDAVDSCCNGSSTTILSARTHAAKLEGYLVDSQGSSSVNLTGLTYDDNYAGTAAYDVAVNSNPTVLTLTGFTVGAPNQAFTAASVGVLQTVNLFLDSMTNLPAFVKQIGGGMYTSTPRVGIVGTGTSGNLSKYDSSGKVVDSGVSAAEVPVKSGTPTTGAGVCWKSASTLGTCTAGTWPNCSTCN